VELKALGMLEIYSVLLLNISAGRELGPDQGSLSEFCLPVHRFLYSENGWSTGELTKCLTRNFGESSRFSKIKIPENLRLSHLASIREDISENQNEFSQLTRKHLLIDIQSEVDKIAAAKQKSDSGGLEGIPESETISLKKAVWGYRLPVMGTCVADDGVYMFQQGHPNYESKSRILIFAMNSDLVELPVPDEIYNLVMNSFDFYALQQAERLGAIEVRPDHIAIAFPGGTASYDRRSEKWSIIPIPFLANRSGMGFAGDRIVSICGGVNGQLGPPVQGLYVTSFKDPKDPRHLALTDTSRRPAIWLMDNSKNLDFTFSPISVSSDRFVVGLRGVLKPWEIFQGRVGEENLARQAYPIPFSPGFGAIVNGTRANGFLLVASVRKAGGNVLRSKDWQAPIQVGAFAIDNAGKYHWLLDTGTAPPVGPIPAGGGEESDRRMFMEDQEPLFRFPSEFTDHRGPRFPRPVVHYDGTRLILLTGQNTSDGRVLLYVWNDRTCDVPTRFALQFDGFGNTDLEDEERNDWNEGARHSIRAIYVHKDHLWLEYDRGFFLLPLKSFERATETE
ncbi:MAG: hypothetical protein ABL994_15875, partial [Verrucomicrobiales bacterium]